jgi:hypothetical protein
MSHLSRRRRRRGRGATKGPTAGSRPRGGGTTMRAAHIGLATGAHQVVMALPALVAPAAGPDLDTGAAGVVGATAWAWAGSLLGAVAWLEWGRRGGMTVKRGALVLASLVSAAALALAGLTSNVLVFSIALVVCGGSSPVVYPLQSAATRAAGAPSAFEGAFEVWVLRTNAAFPITAAVAADAGWWRAPFLGLAVAHLALALSFASTPRQRFEQGSPVRVLRILRMSSTRRAAGTRAAIYFGLGAFWGGLSPLLSPLGIPLVVVSAIGIARVAATRFVRASGRSADYRAERTAARAARLPALGFAMAALAPLAPSWGAVTLLSVAAVIIEGGGGGANVAARRLVHRFGPTGLLILVVSGSFGSSVGSAVAARFEWWIGCAAGGVLALGAAFVIGRWRRRDTRHPLRGAGGRVEFLLARAGRRATSARTVKGWSEAEFARWELEEGAGLEGQSREDNVVVFTLNLTQELTPYGPARVAQQTLRLGRSMDIVLGGKRIAQLRWWGDEPAQCTAVPEQPPDEGPALRLTIRGPDLERPWRVVAKKPV